jgi:RHS repeat-associated protein
MNTRQSIQIALLAAFLSATSALHATVVENTLPVSMPDFQTPAQLAKWRADTTTKTEAKEAAQVAQVSASTPQSFYTGKPYLAESGSYAFKYREYNPEMNRWTTVDPSGFPDGANNQRYAAVPTEDFDYQGLLNWSTLQLTGTGGISTGPGYSITYNSYSINTDDGNYTIQLLKYVSGNPSGADYSYNCAGYVFGASGYWIQGTQITTILKGDGYKQINGPNYTGATIADWGNAHVAKVNGWDSSGNITFVTGKEGPTKGLTTSTPANQYSGTATYWKE